MLGGDYTMEAHQPNGFTLREVKYSKLSISSDLWWQNCFPMETRFYFHDGNVSVHTVKVVPYLHKEYFNKVEHCIWPSEFSDFNIIE